MFILRKYQFIFENIAFNSTHWSWNWKASEMPIASGHFASIILVAHSMWHVILSNQLEKVDSSLWP